MLRLAALSYGVGRVKLRMRKSIAFLCTLLSGVFFAVMGVMFLLHAVWIHLSQLYDPVTAGALVGSGLIAFAAVFTSVLLLIQSRRPTRSKIDLASALSGSSKLSSASFSASPGSQDGLKTFGLIVGMGYLIGRSLARK
jgi:hypothetical protein